MHLYGRELGEGVPSYPVNKFEQVRVVVGNHVVGDPGSVTWGPLENKQMSQHNWRYLSLDPSVRTGSLFFDCKRGNWSIYDDTVAPRSTNMTENIIFLQTTYVGGKNGFIYNI